LESGEERTGKLPAQEIEVNLTGDDELRAAGGGGEGCAATAPCSPGIDGGIEEQGGPRGEQGQGRMDCTPRSARNAREGERAAPPSGGGECGRRRRGSLELRPWPGLGAWRRPALPALPAPLELRRGPAPPAGELERHAGAGRRLMQGERRGRGEKKEREGGEKG